MPPCYGIQKCVGWVTSEIAWWSGWMASLVCLRVVILTFVEEIKRFNGFSFIVKWPIPFLLGITKGQVKNPLFPGPCSIVLLDSIMLMSYDIATSLAFGSLPHTCMMVSMGSSFQLICNWCSYTMLNMKRFWVIQIHLSTNSLSLLYTVRADCHGVGCKPHMEIWRWAFGLWSNSALYALELYGLGIMALCSRNAHWPREHGHGRLTFPRVCSRWRVSEGIFLPFYPSTFFYFIMVKAVLKDCSFVSFSPSASVTYPCQL